MKISVILNPKLVVKSNSTKTLLCKAFCLPSAALIFFLLVFGSSARAASMLFNINADGIKEVNSGGVPNGDPDGFAIGTLTLDSGSGGFTGSATFSLSLGNIAYPLSAHHIHMAPPTTTGGVTFGLGNPETQRSGDTLSGTVTGLSSALVDSIFANPTAFYYNLHNSPFPGGAVRDQLAAVPEPGSVALLLLGLASIGVWMRRK